MKEDGAQSSELPSNSVDPLHSALGPPFFSILIENFANFRCFKVRLGNIVDVRRRCETPYGSSIDSKSLCKRFYDMPSENDDDHPTIWKHIRDAQRWFQQVILFVFEYLWIIFARFSTWWTDRIFSSSCWKFSKFFLFTEHSKELWRQDVTKIRFPHWSRTYDNTEIVIKRNMRMSMRCRTNQHRCSSEMLCWAWHPSFNVVVRICTWYNS